MNKRAAAGKTHNGSTILLVDRRGHFRDALESLISSLASRKDLVTADCESGAMKLVRENPPSLILIGSGLPGAEALDLIRQIKQESNAPRCLVLTGNIELHHSARAAGADQVLPSGLPVGEIFTVIQKLLARQNTISPLQS